jgi:hypothetical protein
VLHGNWKTPTFIAALRHNRVTAPFVCEGAMNGETCHGSLVVLKVGDQTQMQSVSNVTESAPITCPTYPVFSRCCAISQPTGNSTSPLKQTLTNGRAIFDDNRLIYLAQIVGPTNSKAFGAKADGWSYGWRMRARRPIAWAVFCRRETLSSSTFSSTLNMTDDNLRPAIAPSDPESPILNRIFASGH